VKPVKTERPKRPAQKALAFFLFICTLKAAQEQSIPISFVAILRAPRMRSLLSFSGSPRFGASAIPESSTPARAYR
jgi:hypothetical protein